MSGSAAIIPAAAMSQVDDEMLDMLRSIVGEGPPDDRLKMLLVRSGGDVAAAANAFFDGVIGGSSAFFDGVGGSPVPPPAPQVCDDVMSTLFKTLEDQGRKLAGTRLCTFARCIRSPLRAACQPCAARVPGCLPASTLVF